MMSVKQTLPMTARVPTDLVERATQPPAPTAIHQDRVDKLVRLVTLLLVLLAGACVAIGLMLYYFVAKS